MSRFSQYPTKAFSETQKFLVRDPATGSPSFVLGSDLVSYIIPNLNNVRAESTRLAAENTDYKTGVVIQTTGESAVNDGKAAVYLVVGSGQGNFPMLNGNELLLIDRGVTPLSIVTALNDITSLSSLNTAALVADQQFYRGEFWPGTGVGAVNIKWKPDEPVANHNGGTIIDPAKISDLDPVLKTFGTYFTPDTVSGNTGCFVVEIDGPVPVETFGAFPSTTQNSYPAFQKMVDEGVLGLLGQASTYSIDQPIDWSAGRGAGFIGAGGTDRYPETAQTNGRTFKGSRILYIGASSTGAIMKVSVPDIGVELANAFQDSVFGVTLKGFVLDGNDLIDYGLYGYRIQGGELEDILVTRTNKHSHYLTAIYNGTYRKFEAFRCNGSGISWGRGFLDFGFSIAQVNAVTIENMHGHACGLDGAFDETANPLHGYGVGLFVHRGNFIQGILGENNDGANIVYAPSGYSNTICQYYSELANSLDIGAGATAISQGRSTQKWGLWISPQDIGAYNNAARFGNLSGEYVRITGTEPSSSRFGEPFVIEQMSGANGSDAGWAGWVAVNCSPLLTSNALGVSPREVTGAVNGSVQVDSWGVQAYGYFDASTGAIVGPEGFNFSVSYVAVGTYDVSFTDDLDSNKYTVSIVPAAANRIVAVPNSNKSVGGFRILHTNASGTLTDSSAQLDFTVIGKRTL